MKFKLVILAAFVCSIVTHAQAQQGAAEKPQASIDATVPKANIAQYVVDHLDVTSFPSSIGPRRQKGKTTFADYGLYPTKVTDDFVALEETDKSWYFDFKILDQTKTGLVICLQDKAMNGGSYHSQNPLHLLIDAAGSSLIADKDEIKRDDCPTYP